MSMVEEAGQCPQPWPVTGTPELLGIQRPTLASSEYSRPNSHLNVLICTVEGLQS